MKEIYVVMGRAGAYEDYREWPVSAFKSLDKANKFAEMATKWAKSLWVGEFKTYEEIIEIRESNLFDRWYYQDYDRATEYFVHTVPMRWNLPHQEGEL